MKYLIIFLLLVSCSNTEINKYHKIIYKSPYTTDGFSKVLLPIGYYIVKILKPN